MKTIYMEKKGYRLSTESEKQDDRLREGLKTVRGTKKHYTSRTDY